MEKELKIQDNANEIERQAVVCARMGMDCDGVDRVAKARKWRGALRKRLMNRFLNHKRSMAVNPF